MIYRILAINPGSTSTKIAVYDNELWLVVDHVMSRMAEYEYG